MNHEITEVKPGIRRQICCAEGSLMQALIYFDYPLTDTLHSHPHEQCTYVLEGEFEFIVNGRKERRQAGEWIYFAPNVQHCANSLTPGRLLDTFTPQREDFLK